MRRLGGEETFRKLLNLPKVCMQPLAGIAKVLSKLISSSSCNPTLAAGAGDNSCIGIVCKARGGLR